MGGDSAPEEIEKFSILIRHKSNGNIKTAWYSGKSKLPESISPASFNYIKLGPYIEQFGGLNNTATNQRFYKIEDGGMIDRTFLFQIKNRSVTF